jgi:hypothetical protein
VDKIEVTNSMHTYPKKWSSLKHIKQWWRHKNDFHSSFCASTHIKHTRIHQDHDGHLNTHNKWKQQKIQKTNTYDRHMLEVGDVHLKKIRRKRWQWQHKHALFYCSCLHTQTNCDEGHTHETRWQWPMAMQKRSLFFCYMLTHIINYDGHTYETRLEQLVVMQNHSLFCLPCLNT